MRMLVVISLVAMPFGPRAQTNPPAALVARAAAYVDGYEAKFSAVVCEEQQTQKVINANGSIQKHRELVSDLLLVKTGRGTHVFRDVIRVDGKPVRDRPERLRKLFLGGSRNPVQQAGAISKESSRYNIGFRRGVESLLMPLEILHAEHASGFHFQAAPAGLAFDEFRQPAMVGYVDGKTRHDMFLHGTLDVDAGGTITGGSLSAEHPLFLLTVTMKYAEDGATGLLVPTESHEHYQTPKSRDRLDVDSTYANFRRFQVTTSETVAPPDGQAPADL